MDRFKKILVPVDGSRTSYECMRIACHIALQNNGVIHLVHVINTKIIRKVLEYSKTSKLTYENLLEGAEKEGTGIFNDFTRDIKNETAKPMKIFTRILKGENIDEEIINYANSNAIDLIVIPQASKKHAWNVVVGHVALRLVEFARIPVLTIPAVTDERLKEDS